MDAPAAEPVTESAATISGGYMKLLLLLIVFAALSIGQSFYLPGSLSCPSGQTGVWFTLPSVLSSFSFVHLACVTPAPATGVPDVWVYCVSGTCKSMELGNFVVYHNVPAPPNPGPCFPQGNYPGYAVDMAGFRYYCEATTDGSQAIWKRSPVPVATW